MPYTFLEAPDPTALLVDFPARFIPIEDIHLTLLPPWEMTDQELVEGKLRQALKPIKRFTLKFQRLLP